MGHTPNYGIGDSKFRKIVKFSVESLGVASDEGQLPARESAETDRKPENWNLIRDPGLTNVSG